MSVRSNGSVDGGHFCSWQNNEKRSSSFFVTEPIPSPHGRNAFPFFSILGPHSPLYGQLGPSSTTKMSIDEGEMMGQSVLRVSHVIRRLPFVPLRPPFPLNIHKKKAVGIFCIRKANRGFYADLSHNFSS